ncbi:MAG TPA: hypothetical protein VL832_18235 [Puia sp.]|jgi:hypothetical protein|nr:hypothetical protein [Puia sp.]
MKACLLKFSLILAISLIVPSCQLPPAQGGGAIAAVGKTTKPLPDKGRTNLSVDGIVELY